VGKTAPPLKKLKVTVFDAGAKKWQEIICNLKKRAVELWLRLKQFIFTDINSRIVSKIRRCPNLKFAFHLLKFLLVLGSSEGALKAPCLCWGVWKDHLDVFCSSYGVQKDHVEAWSTRGEEGGSNPLNMIRGLNGVFPNYPIRTVGLQRGPSELPNTSSSLDTLRKLLWGKYFVSKVNKT